MSEKCKKTKGGKELTFCENMAEAVSLEYAQLQSLRDNLTGKRRQRVALVKKRTSFPLLCCHGAEQTSTPHWQQPRKERSRYEPR